MAHVFSSHRTLAKDPNSKSNLLISHCPELVLFWSFKNQTIKYDSMFEDLLREMRAWRRGPGKVKRAMRM